MNELIEDSEQDCTVQEREQIVSINLNYRDITQIGFINERYREIQELYLNHNLIESLDGIQQFFNLKILSLKFNVISSPQEFLKVPNKKQLRSLNVIGNPVEKNSKCTYTYFLDIFPSLRCFNDEGSTTPKKSLLGEGAMSSAKKVGQSHRQYMSNEPSIRQGEQSRRTRPADTSRSNRQRKSSRSQRSLLNLNTESFLRERDQNIERYLGDDYAQRTATFAEVQKHKRAHESSQKHLSTNRSLYSDRNRLQTWDSNALLERSSENIDALSHTSTSSSKKRHDHYHSPTDIIDPAYRYCSVRTLESEYHSNNDNSSPMQNSIFEKHISNIEQDIDDLALIFHQKHLSEKAFRALKHNTAAADQKYLFADFTYNNRKVIDAFYAWQTYINLLKKQAAIDRTRALSSRVFGYQPPRTQRDNTPSSYASRDRQATTVRRDYYM